MNRLRIGTATFWSAVTRHRFRRLADLSARQSRVQRLVEKLGRPFAIDGDQSPAESADKSAHSKACGGMGRVRFMRTMKSKSTEPLVCLLATCWLLVSLVGASAQNSEDAKLEAFFRQQLDVTLRERPVAATGLGDHRYDNLMDDISKEARDGWTKQTRATLKQLPRAVDYRELSPAGQIDFKIFEQDLRRDLWMEDNFHPFEEDPRTYGGYINDSVYLAADPVHAAKGNQHRQLHRAHGADPAHLRRRRKQTLTHPPKPILETAIRQNRGAISFYETELFELAGETPQREKLKAAAAPVVAGPEGLSDSSWKVI